MAHRTTLFRRKLKEEDPDEYKAFLEKRRKAEKAKRDEEKRKEEAGELTHAEKEKLELKRAERNAIQKEKYHRKKAKAEAAAAGKRLNRTRGQPVTPAPGKRPKDMSPEEYQRYRAAQRKASRDSQSTQKKKALNAKRRREYHMKKAVAKAASTGKRLKRASGQAVTPTILKRPKDMSLEKYWRSQAAQRKASYDSQNAQKKTVLNGSSKMSSQETVLAEIDVQPQGDGHFYLQTRLKDGGREGFTLTLTDGASVWDGTISEDMLDQLCKKRKMDFNTYVDQTRAAFTRQEMGDLCFEYHLSTQTPETAQLAWKKHLVADDIKFQLGNVKLHKCTEPVKKICSMMSQCISNNRSLQADIKALETTNERLSAERQNALKRLEKCVTAKEELELDLYSKFVAVLNSKKQRIQQLVENGDAESLDGQPDSPVASTSREEIPSSKPETVPAVKNGSQSKQKRSSDSEDPDTDEEDHRTKRQKRSPVPPKIKTVVSDTSLNLGDGIEEEEEKMATVARRPRRQAPSKKQTPAKPVLPRVSSGNSSQRPGSASRKSSLRKSGSDNSNKSTDNLDPDDLLDNF
ncbi:DNA repair protein XRCC4 [Aplysia californica]|uniref:DNA repair protein XRCC4 n=1 Tax=Aplysia californica TaxID=6500 RepID=A0ABM1A4B4_APLCA|nr:DNA repair protein XRCC4 [Aplysia californica]